MFNLFKKKPQYIMTHDGNITVRWNGRSHSIGKTHANYDQIVSMLLAADNYDNLEDLLDVTVAIRKVDEGLTVNQYGEVFWRGEPLHNAITGKIAMFIKQGLPYKPLVNFLTNLQQNPSEQSRNQLYAFLEHKGFPITHDGCFMAYKGVTANFKDRHTKTFDNSPGAVHEMPRESVDPNSNTHCSTGFHVGTREYASNFAGGDPVMLVKVNPRDAVSVPTDHDFQKLRVCRYEVVEICERLHEEGLYDRENYVDPQEDDYCGDDLDDEFDDWDEEEEEEYGRDATGRVRGPDGRFLKD